MDWSGLPRCFELTGMSGVWSGSKMEKATQIVAIMKESFQHSPLQEK